MVIFRQKKIINVRSLGEELHKARSFLNLSLAAVERKIGIAKEYLIAMEENNWEALPSGEVYIKNFLRKYAIFLGLEWEEIERKYEREKFRQEKAEPSHSFVFGIIPKRIIILPKILKTIGVWLVILGVGIYLGFQVWQLLSPPKIKIVFPEDNFTSQNRTIKIVGKLEGGSWLGLNDEEVTVDSNGWFSIDMALNKGLNVIKLEARKSYGRSSTEYRRIIIE